MSESSLKKILLAPYFGDLPEWMDKYEPPKGYHMILDRDLDKFKQRVGDRLGIVYPGEVGSGKPWDYRACLGVLYEEEIKGFDFYGHTDLDCVYGDVNKWLTDDVLNKLDVHSNHNTYVMGAWALYRNIPEVIHLFQSVPNWPEFLDKPEPNGWVEEEFSRALEKSGLRYAYTFWQGNPYTTEPKLLKKDGALYQLDKVSGHEFEYVEIMMYHFRRSKKWPL